MWSGLDAMNCMHTGEALRELGLTGGVPAKGCLERRVTLSRFFVPIICGHWQEEVLELFWEFVDLQGRNSGIKSMGWNIVHQ